MVVTDALPYNTQGGSDPPLPAIGQGGGQTGTSPYALPIDQDSFGPRRIDDVRVGTGMAQREKNNLISLRQKNLRQRFIDRYNAALGIVKIL